MRPTRMHTVVASIAVLFFSSLLLYAALPPVPPTTAPADRTAVMLVPFAPVGETDRYGWIAQALD